MITSEVTLFTKIFRWVTFVLIGVAVIVTWLACRELERWARDLEARKARRAVRERYMK